MERKLHELEELGQGGGEKGRGGGEKEEVQGPVQLSMEEFAEKFFNCHERSPEGGE